MTTSPNIAAIESSGSPVCWIVTDGNPGMENQCLGLAEAMGLVPQIKRFRPPRVLRELMLRASYPSGCALASSSIAPPWPDIVIATGRTSVIAALHIKRASAGRTFTIYIQKPAVDPGRFDCVVAPAHDELRGANVIATLGSLHKITPDLLRREAEKWLPHYRHLPRPYVAVLLGGERSAISPLRRLSSYKLGAEEIAQLGAQLAALARDGKAGLLVTVSRRTGTANMTRLATLLKDSPAEIWDGDGDNPYYGILGLADAILVTCDSVNMISEACSTRKPVQMIQLPGRSAKLAAFHRALMATGRLRPFEGTLESWSCEPLREKERVAALVADAYAEHRRTLDDTARTL